MSRSWTETKILSARYIKGLHMKDTEKTDKFEHRNAFWNIPAERQLKLLSTSAQGLSNGEAEGNFRHLYMLITHLSLQVALPFYRQFLLYRSKQPK